MNALLEYGAYVSSARPRRCSVRYSANNRLAHGAAASRATSRLFVVPKHRLGQPEDVVAAVVYLASEEAGWVTGATLHVNGEMVML